VLIDGVSANEVNAAETAWRPVLDRELKRMADEDVPANLRPEHAHWNWRRKHEVTEGLLVYQMLGIEHDGTMQGLMLVQTAGVFCRLPEQKDKGLVYVMFIATAPWNSPKVVASPRYKYVGAILIAAAIKISLDLGFNGRVGLHSLPQSEDWYAKNMTDVGIDPKKNLRYFEITREQANSWRVL
jgi:hypothetical protein